MRIFSLFFLFFFFCAPSFTQNLVDKSGRKQGDWVKYYEDGKTPIYKGSFKDNKPVGEFKYFDPKGIVKAVIRHLDAHRSMGWYFYNNGQLMSKGLYVDMKKDSIWLNYTAQGEVSSQETFVNNKLHGQRRTFYLEGQIELGELHVLNIENYKDSLLDGSYESRFSSGKTKEMGSYTMGQKDGVWKSNHPNGNVANTVKFDKGKAYGYAYGYDEKGTQISKVYFLKGKALSSKELTIYLDNCQKNGIIPLE